jgi:thiamine transporter ThiT
MFGGVVHELVALIMRMYAHYIAGCANSRYASPGLPLRIYSQHIVGYARIDL